ncbi:MAG: hypothetical protein K9J79_03665 [Desulfobacteraceae bacterium]|nr:hypothetical protein [Desulfobacteraceae bacterium]
MLGFDENQIIGIVIVIAVLLFIREIICWYWKINHGIALLTEIRDLLKTGSYPPKEIENEENIKAEPSESSDSKPKMPCDRCESLVSVKNLKTYNGKQLCPSCLRKVKK